MSQGVRIEFQTLRELASTGITTAYAAIGTPFTAPVRNITITNLTDKTLIFSYDMGVNSHDVLPAGAGKVYDFAANNSPSGMPAFQQGGIVYAKLAIAGAPAANTSAYVSAFYCSGD